MQNLLKNYVQTIVKQELSPTLNADIIEIRNLSDQDQSLILEVGPESNPIVIPFKELNNDSIQSFPKSMSVCLQSLELDCNSGHSVTSNINIETTEKYEINVNGVTTVLYGDALISYLLSLPDVNVVVQ